MYFIKHPINYIRLHLWYYNNPFFNDWYLSNVSTYITLHYITLKRVHYILSIGASLSLLTDAEIEVTLQAI